MHKDSSNQRRLTFNAKLSKKKKKTVGNQIIIFHLCQKITDIMRQFIIHQPNQKIRFCIQNRERERKENSAVNQTNKLL